MSFGDTISMSSSTDEAMMAAARAETPVLSQALAKEMEIVQSSLFSYRLLSDVDGGGLRCDFDMEYSSSLLPFLSSLLWLPELRC